VLFLATGGGAGYFPLFPGTMGTLLAIPLSLALNQLAARSLLLALMVLAGTICGAIWISGRGAEILREKDPPAVVIDEIAGYLVANFLSPLRMGPLLFSFLLFRSIDIIKPYPVSSLEKLPSGRGIVLDDIMAGIYSWVIIQLLFWWDIL
jgi:phosphatidylglycerophosphatase A